MLGNCGKDEMEAGFCRYGIINGFSFLNSHNFQLIKQAIWACGSLFSAVILQISKSICLFFLVIYD